MSDDLRRRVANERRRRGLSARAAASLGSMSNTTWSRFEAGGPLTPAVRSGVAATFGWSTDWPEDPPPEPDQTLDAVSAALGRIEATQEAETPLVDHMFGILLALQEGLLPPEARYSVDDQPGADVSRRRVGVGAPRGRRRP